MCFFMMVQEKNLSSGEAGVCCDGPCWSSGVGVSKVSKPLWDKTVGMAAAQALWGRILDAMFKAGREYKHRHITHQFSSKWGSD